ncbi:MAG: GNAT family N-acetyltransferase [Hyphomicrobiaceae bacterium]
MTSRPDNVRVSQAAAADQEFLARMLQLYLHDFSEFARLDEPYGELRKDGTFWYPDFDSYWREPGRSAFFIWFGERIAGFALVNRWSASGCSIDHAMAEFFILRKYRRRNIGTYAAQSLINQCPGVWEIPVAVYNRPALQFWPTVISSMDDYEIEEIPGDGERWSGTIWRLARDN